MAHSTIMGTGVTLRRGRHKGGSVTEVTAPTVARLGLHVTQAELDVWRDRAINGPYKTQGTVNGVVNAPGDFDRIVGYKNDFTANPAGFRWAGPVDNNPGGVVRSSATTDSADTHTGYTPGHTRPSAVLRDSAFWALIQRDAMVANACADELYAQSQVAGLQFASRDRWAIVPGPSTDPASGDNRVDAEPWFHICSWLSKLLFAYEYLVAYETENNVSVFTPARRTAVLRWLWDAADYFSQRHDPFIDVLFTDRAGSDPALAKSSSNYALSSVATQQGAEDQIVYYGGPQTKRLHARYNNRHLQITRLIGLVGVQQNVAVWKDQARKFVKEMVRFSSFPQGAMAEMERWTATSPTKGYTYALSTLGPMLTIADHFARDGDHSLYTYATAYGDLGTEGQHVREGADRSLLTCTRDIARYVVAGHADGYDRYGTDSAANAGNVAYRINPEDGVSGRKDIRDANVLAANLYFNDAFVAAAVTRQHAGAPAYPSNPAHGHGDPEAGEWGIYPGAHFMYAGLNGLYDVYPQT